MNMGPAALAREHCCRQSQQISVTLQGQVLFSHGWKSFKESPGAGRALRLSR